MTTFLDIQNRVQDRVIDLPPKVLADIPNLINEAIRSAQRRYNFRAMEGSVVLVTTAGSLTPTPNTIANFKEYKDRGPYMLNYLSKARPEIVTDSDTAALAALADPLNPGEPLMLLNELDDQSSVWTFSVYPYPDANSDWADGNYRIVVPYYYFTPKLVNATDTNWFVENMDDYIYREATAQAFGLDWDYESKAVWLQEAENKFREAKNADKTNRLGGVDALVPQWEGANKPRIIY